MCSLVVSPLSHDFLNNVRLWNTGIYGIYNLKALAVAPERSEGATKGLRVINFVVLCV